MNGLNGNVERIDIKKVSKKMDILILNHGIYNLSRENSNYENQ